MYNKAKKVVETSNVHYKDIAKSVGCSYGGIYRTLNGSRKLDYITAVKIAKKLGKKPDELFYNDAVKYIKEVEGGFRKWYSM